MARRSLKKFVGVQNGGGEMVEGMRSRRNPKDLLVQEKIRRSIIERFEKYGVTDPVAMMSEAAITGQLIAVPMEAGVEATYEAIDAGVRLELLKWLGDKLVARPRPAKLSGDDARDVETLDPSAWVKMLEAQERGEVIDVEVDDGYGE